MAHGRDAVCDESLRGWQELPADEPGMNGGAAEYGRLARQLEHEVAAARPIVAAVRRMPSAYLDRLVPTAWRTVGFVEELSNAANECLEEAPEKSEGLAELATKIVVLLGDRYPRVLRAQSTARAWKELAKAHRYRSKCGEALRALDRADAALAEEPALAEEQAILDLTRATVLREMNRLSDARAYLSSAVVVFRDHGSFGRVAQCELLGGMIEHTWNPQAARTSYRRAAVAARQAGDVKTVASAYSNLAVLDAEAGRIGAAFDGLQQARAIFKEVGATGEIARTTWAVGLVLARAEKYGESLAPLREARQTFLGLRMAEEAGLAGIQMSEAYLALGKRHEAEELVRAIIIEFQDAELAERAIAAVKHLRELGEAATRDHARHVATYLERLRREPMLLFQPFGEP